MDYLVRAPSDAAPCAMLTLGLRGPLLAGAGRIRCGREGVSQGHDLLDLPRASSYCTARIPTVPRSTLTICSQDKDDADKYVTFFDLLALIVS